MTVASPLRSEDPAGSGHRGHDGAVDRRERLLRRLGLAPAAGDVVRLFLDEALPEEGAVVLDAGCGRVSALRPFRARIGRLIGLDIHAPAAPLEWIDEFVVADLCEDRAALPQESLDVVLSSFAVEHLADPVAGFVTLAGWLRPGGWLVLSTVNRRHPFVELYCRLPRRLAAPLQRAVKAGPADAHPLVGACNTPADVRAALRGAGFVEVELITVDHLARAWGRRRAPLVVGLTGDLAAHPFPSRRSTIVARAQRPPTGTRPGTVPEEVMA